MISLVKNQRQIWTAPRLLKPQRHRKDKTPFVLSGLWNKLSAKKRVSLSRLGFDEASWNNNVREQVVLKDEDMLYGGGVTFDKRHEVMTGDRARVSIDYRDVC